MKKFHKITVGFVTQMYLGDIDGKFACTSQEFIAGDQVDYEVAQGNTIGPPEHEYQLFNMTLLSSQEIADRINEALECIDIGGEQSRQFSHEIAILKKLIKNIRR